MTNLIMATQGLGRYLLFLGPDEDGIERASIVDTTKRRVYPPMSTASHLARGYWKPIIMSQEESDAIVAACNAVQPRPGPTAGATTVW